MMKKQKIDGSNSKIADAARIELFSLIIKLLLNLIIYRLGIESLETYEKQWLLSIAKIMKSDQNPTPHTDG